MEFEEPKSSKKHFNSSQPSQGYQSKRKDNTEEKCISMFKSQMEYYFSDANLVKDHYLTNLIEKHKRGYVDIVEFLRFNKIKEISLKHSIPFIKALPLLIKGIERSDKLKLNKLNDKVRRKEEFKYSKKLENDQQKRTIYVEQLQPHINREQLADVFKKCGEIVSVDLPRYKNDLNKGFAFIMFGGMAGVEAALKLNNTVPKEICLETRSIIRPLRVISFAEWKDYKIKFTHLKEKLRNIYTERKDDSEYVYIKFMLKTAVDDTTKDELELYLKQIDVDTFYIDTIGSYEVVVKVWDYTAYAKIDEEIKAKNELFSFVKSISTLSDRDFREYLQRMEICRARVERNKRIKKLKSKKRSR